MSEAIFAVDLAAMHRFQELQGQIARETDLRAGLNQVLAVACEFAGTDRGCIELVNENRSGLEMFSWRGYAEDSPFLKHFRLDRLLRDRSGGSDRLQERVVIEDCLEVTPAVEDPTVQRVVTAENIRALQATPMISRNGRPVGMLSTQWREPHLPMDLELRLIEMLARTAADFVERHSADQARSRQDERLHQMVNVPGIGILTFDPSTGVLIDANDAFLEISGYTRDMVDKRELTWRTMTPDEWVAISEVEMKVLEKTGRIGPYEKEYLRADGTRCWMLFSGARIADGTVVEYCIDITKLKPAGNVD